MESGRGGVGSSKHRKSGHIGHNADTQQLARDLNREARERQSVKSRKKVKTYDSLRELMRNRRARTDQ